MNTTTDQLLIHKGRKTPTQIHVHFLIIISLILYLYFHIQRISKNKLIRHDTKMCVIFIQAIREVQITNNIGSDESAHLHRHARIFNAHIHNICQMIKAYSNFVDGHAWLNFANICDRAKSGNFGHQVNSDIHLQTKEMKMRRLLMSRLIRIFTVALVN